jgi:hypothetical protein
MKAFAALALGLALLLAAVPAHGMELSETEMDNVGKAFRAAIEAMRAKPTDRFLPPEKYDHAFDGLLFVNRDLDAAAMVVHCPTPPPFGYARLVVRFNQFERIW